MYVEFDNEPNVVSSALMGVVLLALFILIGFILLFPEPAFPFAEFIYPFITIIILSLLGSRGRFDSPTLTQYIVTFLIALIPILGTLYVAYYAGISITRYRVLILSLLSLLLLLIMVILLKEVNLDTLSKFSRGSQLPTATLLASPTEKIATSTTSTTIIAPTETLETLATEIETAITNPVGCYSWSEITIDRVGEELCVYGEYDQIVERTDGTHVMNFSSDPGSFNIWSYPKPLWWYLETIDGKCIMVEGQIITSGIRPIIMLGSQDTIMECP
jgi:hypothetical protein